MKKSLDHNITDALITSDEWESFDYNLRLEIEELAKIDYDNKPEKWKKHTLASSYLYYAEKLLREAGAMDGFNINTIRELRKRIIKYEGLRTFYQTIRLATIIARTGIIPAMARMGKAHSDEQSEKAKIPRTRDGITPQERAERDQKIRDDYKSVSKNSSITLHAFALKHANKYGLKTTQFKKILTS